MLHDGGDQREWGVSKVEVLALVDILARVQLSRAEDHVREFNAALAPWRREPAVREFIHRTRKELGVAA
ncbi:hypothetical protein ACFYUJ_32220 [Streptomyces sp. NPDC004520]|uniref:hypothetical protein n=1 Tax=Streptomyces sp. NPDC004520 TaxID=3364702 RepID=UPI0036C1CC63